MRMDVTGFVTFIGVDLHKCSVTLRAVRADGEVLGHLTCNTKCIERIDEWITELPGPKWMAVEACPFVEWFIDRYTPCVDRMDIADATEPSMRRGKRRKNDPNDALDIALQLARGECPLGYIAHFEESAGRTQSGNITKAGSATLRCALCQAAVTLCQSDVEQEATRQRFIARMPKTKADVVMGRRLLRTLYAMARDQKPYQCGERRDRTKAANKAKATRRARALQLA